jgi:signal transduction histidine kinase
VKTFGLFLILAVSLIAQPVSAPNAAGRSITHAPDVPQPPKDGISPEYRTAITAIAKRYNEVYYSANYPAALALARDGLSLAVQNTRLRDEAEFLRSALYVSWLMGESETGLEYGQRLLVRADQLDDDRLRSFAHRVLGSIQKQLGDRPKLREETQLALAAAERAHDEPLRLGALNNLGAIAFEDGDLTTARRNHEEVLAYREKAGNRWDIASSLTNLAEVCEKEKNLPGALVLHERALALRTEVNDYRGQVRSLFQVAGILRQLNRTDEALARLTDARIRAEKIGGHELLANVYAELTLTHETRRDYASALETQRLAAREREVLGGDRARSHAAELEVRYGLARQQETIAKLATDRALQTAELKAKEAELARASTFRLSLIIGGATGALAFAVIIALLRARLSAERRLRAETQSAREVAEHADAIKTRFIHIASNDIRGPLTNILHLMADLQSERSGPPDVRIDSVISEAQRVLSLVQDLIDTAALEAGDLKLHRKSIDLRDTVRSALATQRWQAELKRQQLTFNEPPPGLTQILGDPTRLAQVVSNLASNAIKLTPAGKGITVDLVLRGSTLVLSVRDQGAGLSPEDITKTFRPSTRISPQSTDRDTSHGLGFSIVDEIVRLHGGTIRVESSPGQGSAFIVELPTT